MRLDKFLQVSRLVKRRTVAISLCRRGRIAVNGHKAKAGKELATGDILSITFSDDDMLVCEVVEVPFGNVPKAKAPTLYRRINESVPAHQ